MSYEYQLRCGFDMSEAVPEAAQRIPVNTLHDAGVARRASRDLAASLGFSPPEAEEVAVATSELATNLARYARRGVIVLAVLVEPDGRKGIQVESCDEGPGIEDIERAMVDGFSTGGGLGGGLGGVRRLMDEFEAGATPEGTRIVARKWLRRLPSAPPLLHLRRKP